MRVVIFINYLLYLYNKLKIKTMEFKTSQKEPSYNFVDGKIYQLKNLVANKAILRGDVLHFWVNLPIINTEVHAEINMNDCIIINRN